MSNNEMLPNPYVETLRSEIEQLKARIKLLEALRLEASKERGMSDNTIMIIGAIICTVIALCVLWSL